jgi:GNAT superfamily N-acetyltransferase
VDLKVDGRAIARLVGILKEHRGRGHGSALMWLVEDFAGARACTKVVLNSTADALPFYMRLGYTEQEWDPTDLKPQDTQVVKEL